MKSIKTTSQRYFDRDLSWLSFNYRVLMEAKNKQLPVYDRIKFLGIFSSNLDEFFRVRVASLKSLAAIDKKKIRKKLELEPDKLLHQIKSIVTQQQQEFGQIFKSIIPQLRREHIVLYQQGTLTKEQQTFVKDYFFSKVLSYLQPVILSSDKKYFLNNRQLYLMFQLHAKNNAAEKLLAYLNIPSDHLPRFIPLPESRGKSYFMYLEDIIRSNISFVFPGYEVESSYSIKLNRDADLQIDDEYEGNLVEKIRKNLSKRNVGEPSRFLYDIQMPADMLNVVIKTFGIEREDCVEGGRYHNLHDLLKFPNPNKPALATLPLPTLRHSGLDQGESMFEALDIRDQVLHFPYQSYDYVLRFFNEAAIHPDVKEIKVTLYRIARHSYIANALISAARNGKKVSVFLEIKARFDEENNLKWAKEMEEAGVKIMYSLPGLKVHAKIACIKLKQNGKSKEYAYFGTGNFNEVTAGIYADHALLTAHKGMIKDLKQVFKFLEKQQTISQLKHLLVAQTNMQEKFVDLIDREISHAKAGKKACLTIKLNNLEEKVMIDKLYEASEAGVFIQLIVRGICCLVPGTRGMSSNIRVVRIVDRYLEHARIFIFHNGGDEQIYLSSADWMKRNLYRRIEVAFPLYDEEIRKEIKKLIDLQLKDDTKACLIDHRLNNRYIINTSASVKPVRSQEDFYYWLKRKSNHK